MTVRVATYLRTADGGFIPFSEAPARPPEARGDIEGSVELRVDGTAVLTKETWDAVDLLWVVLCRWVAEFVETGSATTTYPVQQVDIAVRRIPRPGWVVVSRGLTGEKPHVRVAVPERELLTSLLAGAEEFFERLDTVAPARPSYAEALRIIRTAVNGR